MRVFITVFTLKLVKERQFYVTTVQTIHTTHLDYDRSTIMTKFYWIMITINSSLRDKTGQPQTLIGCI